MNYRGVIIEESLVDNSVFKEVITISSRVSKVTEKHKTPWLTQWTLRTVEVTENKADEIAEKLSKDLQKDPSSWYADYKNDSHHFIVFPGKIFKVNLKNPVLYQEARKYGIGLGIPEYQVDFGS